MHRILSELFFLNSYLINVGVNVGIVKFGCQEMVYMYAHRYALLNASSLPLS